VGNGSDNGVLTPMGGDGVGQSVIDTKSEKPTTAKDGKRDISQFTPTSILGNNGKAKLAQPILLVKDGSH